MKEYNASVAMFAEAEALEKELALLQISKDNFGLIHYDFEPDNVFYEAESNSCFVIDFEDGMYHFFLLDIEQVFGSLEEELEGEELAQAKEQFLQGYRREKALGDEYEKQLPLMRRFCNLYAYARLIRCVAEEIPEEPEWLSNLRDVLEQKIKYFEEKVK